MMYSAYVKLNVRVKSSKNEFVLLHIFQALPTVDAASVFHVPLQRNVKATWRIVVLLPTVIPTGSQKSLFALSVLMNKPICMIIVTNNDLSKTKQSN